MSRISTPLRLRIWTASIVAGALALLVSAGLGLNQLRSEIRTVGTEAAPLAATASDLYFALSDLEAQIARLVMINNASALSNNELDASLTYQRRSAQIDADIQRILGAATTDTDRAAARRLLDQVAIYRQLAWQALAVEGQEETSTPGVLPPAALGYYTHATNVLHFQLLPTAKLLRQSSQDRLDAAYRDQRATAVWGVALTLLFGLALIALLLFVQLRLAIRYRRLVNPLLAVATLVTVGLVVSATFVFLDEPNRLRSAQDNHFAPYLGMTQAQAVSYDAAADTSRYLLSGKLDYYAQDFTDKSNCLTKGGPCGPGADVLPSGTGSGDGLTSAQSLDILNRWKAYERDHQQVLALADSDQAGAAIDKLTGIRRGDAAFDFYYYDSAVTGIASGQRQAFDTSMANAADEVDAWPILSVVLMIAVIVLVLLGFRPRLAEYR